MILEKKSHRTSAPKMIFIAGLLLVLSASSCPAQPPQRGPGGGPNAPDIEIVKDFDADGDGVLNTAERKEARASLKKNAARQQPRGARAQRGGRGLGGPGGPPPGGGPGGFGGPPPGGGGGGGRPGARFSGDMVKGKAGKPVKLADVEAFPDAGLYDTNVLRTMFIEFEAKDWEDELADFKPTDVEVPAKVTVDGQEYPNVGLSFRGASSFFSIPTGLKRSLNLSMDFMDKEQRLYGYKSLNLLNCNGDPSMMSSLLYSQIGSQKMATPKVNFMKVVINGRSWGIYANAQQFNKDFLKENYGSKKGTRWKVSGSPRGDAGLRYLGENPDPYRSRFEIKSKDKEQAWKDLIQLCKLLNETPADQLIETLDPILDLDGVLWFLAVDVALINSDGYWTRASDYSIYQNAEGKFHILPHDMNESFREMHGGRGGGGRGGQRGGGQRGGRRGGGPPGGGLGGPGGPPGGLGAQAASGQGYELDPLAGIDSDRFPLRSKLLANSTLKTRYLQYLRLIAREHIAWDKMKPLVSAAKELIETEVKRDTRKLVTFDSFSNATELKSTKPKSLREFAEKRSEFLLNHPAIKDLPEVLVELPQFSSPDTEEGSGASAVD